jgi:toxin YoeB
MQNPHQTPPTFEKPIGDLAGAYSRRINIHNRLVYEVFETEHVVRVLRMWTLYE